jgi:hypothetical protein
MRAAGRETVMDRTLGFEPDHRFARVHGPAQLCVTHGTLWLTVDGEPDDHVLARGECATLAPGAHALVQALDLPARARVATPAVRWAARLRHAWRTA